MKHQIRGSDVYVTADIERILSALAGASRRYSGDYGAGYADALRDVAAAVGVTVDTPQMERITERYERYERTVERYTPPAPAAPERRFAIRGEREAWPTVEDTALARPAPVNMSGDDVNITLFNPAAGRLVARQLGYGWFGHDGYTAFWNASDWQQVSVDEARAWGELVPDDYGVLVRHAYANDKRRQLGQSVRVLPTERRMLR